MTFFDFSNILVLGAWICLFLIFTICGFVKKSSWFNFVTLLLSVILLIVHLVFRIEYSQMNVVIDFIFLILSIFMYLYVDDIEARREVISEVFENKYKKKKKK